MSSPLDRESHLTLEQSRLVSQFLEWTGSTADDLAVSSSHGPAATAEEDESQQETRDHAIRTLARYEWNLQKALEDHLLVNESSSRSDSRSTESRERLLNASRSSTTATSDASASSSSSFNSDSYFWLILQSLWRILWLPLEYLLTESLQRPSRDHVSISYAQPLPVSLTSGPGGSDDAEGALSKLLCSASGQPLFHVVFIDSRHHMASPHSRSVVLQDARVAELFRSNEILFYDLDVTTPLGWHTVLRLHLTNFPVLALIRQPTQPKLVSTQVLALTTTAETVLEWIQKEKRRLTQRSAATQLREEQESAYMRSLSIDRAKAEQKARVEAEKHALDTTLARKRAELESERSAALAAWQKQATGPQEKATQRLSLRLPSGRRVLLNVALETCSLLALYGALYAQLTEEDEPEESDSSKEDYFIWTLDSHYPRKSFALDRSTSHRSLLALAISDGMTLYAESTSLREELEEDHSIQENRASV